MVKIFVGNIADGVTSQQMRELFEKHGRVTECDVLGTYGFVHMETDEEAEEAIKNLDKRDVNGSMINVEKSKGARGAGVGRGGGFMGARPGSRGGGTFGGIGRDMYRSPYTDNSANAKSARRLGCTKLHVANLPENVHADELRKLFERYGYVAECDTVDEKKIAFVHIEDGCAQAAIDGLNGYNFKGIPLKVQMSKNQNNPHADPTPAGVMRGPARGGMIPTIQGRGRGVMYGSAAPYTEPAPARFPTTEYRVERPIPPVDRYGSNGDSSFGEHNLPPPAKDRMELLDLLDRRRRLEALDPYERRLIACPDPFALPPPPPEYLRLLRERALVKARLPLPPSSSSLSRTLPTAGSSTSSTALTRAILARRAAAVASSLKDKPPSVYDLYGATKSSTPLSYGGVYQSRANEY